jgi:uncharacterized repeat protein (TIGR03803 family)
MMALSRLGTMLAALGCVAMARGAAPNVVYSAYGTFATPPISGADRLCLEGQQFSIQMVANEALKPTIYTKNSATYANVMMQAAVYSCSIPQPIEISITPASITLRMGAAGQPDELDLSFITYVGAELTFTAQATLPPGTLRSRAILPFTAPVPLTLTNVTVTYSDTETSTTLGIAGGTLSAALQSSNPDLSALVSFGTQNGELPNGLLAGPGGTLYGTTYGGGGSQGTDDGTVFVLTPPGTPQGTWEETVIHVFPSFAGDGGMPSGGLAAGADGALYGSTLEGGPDYLGTVYQLTPPDSPGGGWTETVLHTFGAVGDGYYPAPVTVGANGVVYGTTANDTVFALTPPREPGGNWTETLLYIFTGENGDGLNPMAGVIIGSGTAGRPVLYGTTAEGGSSGGGTVFQLAPSGGVWKETVLYSFTGVNGDGARPEGPLTLGADGAIYGTTYAGGPANMGTVFRLTPPRKAGGAWRETVLYAFQGMTANDGANPMTGLLIGPGGSLVGATYGGGPAGCGTVFQLTPPGGSGGSWAETILATFDEAAGTNPGNLVWGSGGAIYGTANFGGAFNWGTVFELQTNEH